MITVETAVRQILISDTDVAAELAGNIYPDAAPQNIVDADPSKFRPYAVYEIIADAAEHHIAASSGLAYAVLRYTSVSMNATEARAISEAIREALDGYSGVVTVGAETLAIEVITIERTRRNYAPPRDAGAAGTYMMIQEMQIGYQQSVPVFS